MRRIKLYEPLLHSNLRVAVQTSEGSLIISIYSMKFKFRGQGYQKFD